MKQKFENNTLTVLLWNFWRARTNSALDPETSQGLAKPYYEGVAALLTGKNDPRGIIRHSSSATVTWVISI